LLEAAGIYVMNIEEAREYGLQLRAKADDSIIGSANAKHVLGEGGVDGLGGSNSFFQPTFDL
jgi:hypothetical protein